MNTIIHNKLVRDKIPDIIATNGDTAKTRTLTNSEYITELKRKLSEEVNEYLASDSPEELADILEVVYTLASLSNLDQPHLEQIRQQKQIERGGFNNRIFLIHTQTNRDL